MTWIYLNVLIENFKTLNSGNVCYYNLIQNTYLVVSHSKQTDISWYHTVRKTVCESLKQISLGKNSLQ